MILVNHYAILPLIFIKHYRVETKAFPCVLFHHDRFVNVSLSGVTNLSLLVGVCAACMLAYKCLQMKWLAAVTVVVIPSQKALLMCPYVSSGKFSVLAPRCSRALLNNLQLTSDRCFIFASHFAGYRNDPCNCHHFSSFMSPRYARVVQILP